MSYLSPQKIESQQKLSHSPQNKKTQTSHSYRHKFDRCSERSPQEEKEEYSQIFEASQVLERVHSPPSYFFFS